MLTSPAATCTHRYPKQKQQGASTRKLGRLGKKGLQELGSNIDWNNGKGHPAHLYCIFISGPETGIVIGNVMLTQDPVHCACPDQAPRMWFHGRPRMPCLNENENAVGTFRSDKSSNFHLPLLTINLRIHSYIRIHTQLPLTLFQFL